MRFRHLTLILVVFSFSSFAKGRLVQVKEDGSHCSEGIHKDKKYIVKSGGYADNVPIKYSLMKLGNKKFQLGFNMTFKNSKHKKGAEYCAKKYPIRSSDGRQVTLNISDREAPHIHIGIDNHSHPSMYGWNHSMANVFKVSESKRKKICMVYLHEIMHSTGLVEEYSGRSQALAKARKKSSQSGMINPFTKSQIKKRTSLFGGQIGRTGCRAVVRENGLFSGRRTRQAFLYKNQMDVVTNPFCGRSAKMFKQCAPLFYAHDQRRPSFRKCNDEAAKKCIAEAQLELNGKSTEVASLSAQERALEQEHGLEKNKNKNFKMNFKKMASLTTALAPLGLRLYQNFQDMRTPANLTSYQAVSYSPSYYYPVTPLQTPVLAVRQENPAGTVGLSPVRYQQSKTESPYRRVIGR